MRPLGCLMFSTTLTPGCLKLSGSGITTPIDKIIVMLTLIIMILQILFQINSPHGKIKFRHNSHLRLFFGVNTSYF